MSLIEVKANYITYWKSTVTTLGFVKEVAQVCICSRTLFSFLQRERNRVCVMGNKKHANERLPTGGYYGKRGAERNPEGDAEGGY